MWRLWSVTTRISLLKLMEQRIWTLCSNLLKQQLTRPGHNSIQSLCVTLHDKYSVINRSCSCVYPKKYVLARIFVENCFNPPQQRITYCSPFFQTDISGYQTDILIAMQEQLSHSKHRIFAKFTSSEETRVWQLSLKRWLLDSE
mmetsp:Transcript_12515/g.25145  ORF Transcript_12515/g.25145 Transcript_12515/m.25145 type:complete len:144 (-) Transcript_12515:1544-1975(-)